MTATDKRSTDDEDEKTHDHLADIDDGCGCVDIWEALSEQRVKSNAE